jgi:hypothetical protein
MPAAADSSGSGSFVGTIEGKPHTVTFKDVYAFRTENRQKEQITVVVADTGRGGPGEPAPAAREQLVRWSTGFALPPFSAEQQWPSK